MKTVLLFGASGKMGTALSRALAGSYRVTGLSSADLDARDFAAVRARVERDKPDIAINAVAMLGIDACEKDPNAACRLNAYLPRLLARLMADSGGTMVHFSTETVFSGALGRPLTEDDEPDPVNVYGHSKYMGDLLVRDATPRHYLFRLPVLFGPSAKRNQLLERMLDKARAGEPILRLAADIVTSPTLSLDVAHAVRRALDDGWDHGLYHLANAGQASLYELVSEAVRQAGLATRVEPASCHDFPSLGKKNTVTPLVSRKRPPLRSWQEALGAMEA
ncbi:MAG: NAD(P)-dependent oxidoreductase [Magnetospirillum sp. WYHS-4]